MKLSVAIPTWNRASMLGRTLEQMTRMRVPAGVDWELVVVNNNSTDDTDRVIASFAPRLPVRGVHEPHPGVAWARNRGVAEAKGEYILWTDDDVRVDEGWMEAYCAAFARWPNAVVFGGPIEPWFGGTVPPWLSRVWDRVASAYGARDLGAEPRPLFANHDSVPFGANYAVVRTAHCDFSYDTRLGVRPGRIVGGEETSLMQRLLRAYGEGWWVPDARVRHYVAPHELTTRYLRRYNEGHGRYLRRTGTEDSVPHLFGQPRWAWRQAIERGASYLVRRALRQAPELWIDDLIESSRAWGYLREPAPVARTQWPVRTRARDDVSPPQRRRA